MLSFKDQCWARLHEDQRLFILGEKEEKSAKGFEYQDYKFKARQALQLWRRALMASSFRSWDEYKEEVRSDENCTVTPPRERMPKRLMLTVYTSFAHCRALES